jgi:hypothetical protein
MSGLDLMVKTAQLEKSGPSVPFAQIVTSPGSATSKAPAAYSVT